MKKFWSMKVNASDAGVGEIYLYSEIASTTWWGDEVTPMTFKEDLDALGDIQELRCYINSPGGDVFAGIAIYNMIRRHKAAKKTCYVDGLAASIASVVMCAFDTVVVYENSTVMVHNPWTFMFGGYNAEQLQKMAEDLQAIREPLIASYVSKTGLSRDEVVALMDAETWMDANTCKEKGFADVIEEAKKIAACLRGDVLNVNGQAFDLAKYQYHNRPKVQNEGELPTPTPIVEESALATTETFVDAMHILSNIVAGVTVEDFAKLTVAQVSSMLETVQKVVAKGRVLSAENEDHIRSAHDALGKVLDKLASDDGDVDDAAPRDPDEDPNKEPDGPDDKCDPKKGALDVLLAKVDALTAKVEALTVAPQNVVEPVVKPSPQNSDEDIVIEPDEVVVLDDAVDEVDIEADTLKQAVKAAFEETKAELQAKKADWVLANLGKVD